MKLWVAGEQFLARCHSTTMFSEYLNDYLSKLFSWLFAAEKFNNLPKQSLHHILIIPNINHPVTCLFAYDSVELKLS